MIPRFAGESCKPMVASITPHRTSDRLPCANRADGFSAGFSCHWAAGQRMCYPWGTPQKKGPGSAETLSLAQRHRK